MLDTTAFSDLMREHPRLQARLSALSPAERMSLSPVVRGEILHGLARLPDGQRKEDLQDKAARLFQAVLCWPITEAVGDHYAEIKLARQRKGLVLDENDLWIAAAAREAGATLVTRDTDFPPDRGAASRGLVPVTVH
jgi:predicted nucleic acid-binding protein